MPTSARKSSLVDHIGPVSRRGPQKPHVPYREGAEVGKKTGIAVEHVQRKSDGFEPFEDVIGQADKRTPPKVKNTKKKQRIVSPLYEDEDEDGEMSMEMDDSTAHSPMSFYANNRYPGTEDGASRVASSSRHTRISDVDFDQVPSHRPRKSAANGSPLRPSALSQSHIPDPDPDDSHNQGGMDGDFEDYAPPEDDYAPQDDTPRRSSFTQIDRDEDDEGDDPDDAQMDPESPIRNSNKDKTKGRTQIPDSDDNQVDPGTEDAIAQGLEDVELDVPSEDDEDEEHQRKKPRTEKQAQKSKTPRGRSEKREKVIKERSPTPPGVRRGRRHRYRPLEWWRQEKVVYGNTDDELVLVPHIKEIIRIPKEPVQPLGQHAKRKRKATTPRSKSKTPAAIFNPEEDWDKDTESQGVVVDFITKDEVERRVAFTSKMVTPKAAANNDWFFQKVFGDGDFIAAGQLVIPPKGKKPSKGTKDNTYIFYVIEGAIQLKIHETSLILCTGGMFLVPRGNTYYIENISDRNAKLFFTQARKIAMSEAEEEAAAMLAPGTRRLSETRGKSSGPMTGSGRSSSAGAVPRVNGSRPPSKGPAKRAASTKI